MTDPVEAPRHPLIVGLFQALPADGAVWPGPERRAWLRMAVLIFEMLYARPDGDAAELEVRIVPARHIPPDRSLYL
jgi:hypothetical protein